MVDVKSAGLYSSIQDRGRFGYRKFGVPVSGAMDLYSAKFANALLNNHLDCAVLESTIIGPKLIFNEPTFIVIAGAECELKINRQSANLNTVIKINSGDTLKIGKIIGGVRNYIAVAGGWQTPLVLNSRSYYSGVTKDAILKSGDQLAVASPGIEIINRTTVKFHPTHININELQVTKGPEFDLLDQQPAQTLLNQTFKISSQSNRMAYKLERKTGQLQNLNAKEIITSSVQPGTVQMTPTGELIVLMRDCQTTGGYARVLQLSESSINQLAQKPIGSRISFKLL